MFPSGGTIRMQSVRRGQSRCPLILPKRGLQLAEYGITGFMIITTRNGSRELSSSVRLR